MDYKLIQGKNILGRILSPLLLFTFLFVLPSSFSYGSSLSLYVSPDGSGDGSSHATPTTLQAALDAAHGTDTVWIYLRCGLYDQSLSTLYYSLSQDESVFLFIRGGISDEGIQLEDPSLTILDGDSINQIFHITAQAENALLDIRFSNLSFINGLSQDDGIAETIDHGGAIMTYEGNADLHGRLYLQVKNCDFMNNRTVGNFNGGAIFTNGSLEIEHCRFTRNTASSGGAIICYAGHDADQSRVCSIRDSRFFENMNFGNQGSSVWHNVTMEISDCDFYGMEDGSLVGNGSCVWGNSGSTHRISGCLFRGIKVKYWGSAIQSFGGNAYIDNCIFRDNKAGEEYGTGDGYGTLAFYHNNQPATVKRINNCTFVNNRSRFSTSSGGAIHNRGLAADDFLVSNCIFENNGPRPIYSTGTTGVVMYSCCVTSYEGFTDGGGMTTLSPLFSDDDLHLSENSPCVNTGINDAIPERDTDIEGNLRIRGGTIDMGALELNHAPFMLELSDTLLSENSGTDYVIGELSALDDDIEDQYFLVFELIEGDGLNGQDNDKVKISSNQLITAVNPDFEEKEVWNILVGVSDLGKKSTKKVFLIQLNNENDPVVLNGSIDDQSVTIGELFSFTFDESLFTDQDEGDVLEYSAALTDGGDLPGWLEFDPINRNFSGNTTGLGAGRLEIRLKAADNQGSEEHTDFRIILSYPAGILQPGMESFRLYPNPAGDFLVIEQEKSGKKCVAGIWNSRGELEMQLVLRGKKSQTDISRLVPGLYFIKIEEDVSPVGCFIKK